MNKCFCDKCKKELKGKEKHTGEIRIRGFYSKSFYIDYCETCLEEIIGDDNYKKYKQEQSEREQRIAERKKSREGVE